MKSQRKNNSKKTKKIKKNAKRNIIRTKKMRGGSDENAIDYSKLRNQAAKDNDKIFNIILKDINNANTTTELIFGTHLRFGNDYRDYGDWNIRDEWGGFEHDECQKVFSTRIAKAIADILIKSDCKIKKLIMSNNYITSEGAGQIAKALESNTSLEILDISNNDLKETKSSNIPSIFRYNNNNKIDWKFDILPWEKTLKKSLETNNTLKTLNISNTKSNLELLLRNSTMPNVKELDISENILDSFELESFLENNKSITSLTMKNMTNFKDDEDNVLKALRNGLRQNTTLTKLNISNNFKNHERNLISNNNIRNESILLDIFKVEDIDRFGKIPNRTLVEFNIDDNNFSDDVKKKISDALENNKKLVNVSNKPVVATPEPSTPVPFTENSIIPKKKKGLFGKLFRRN